MYGERPVNNRRAHRAFDAFRRARVLSGLGSIEFTYRLLTHMEVDIDTWDADLRKAGLEGVTDMAMAIEDGRLVPSAEALFAAAEIADCTVGVLCGDGPLAEEVYRLRRELRAAKVLSGQGDTPGTDLSLLDTVS